MIVTELAKKGNLLEYLRMNKGKVGLKRKVKWCLQISQALTYLHTPVSNTSIILHRDLKAENILICDGLIAKVGDFG